MVEFSENAAKRIIRGVKTAERLAGLPKPGRRRLPNMGQGGGAAILAVVTECTYDDDSHSLMVTCSRLLARDYDFDPTPDDADEFMAWGGIDPLIVVDSIVLLFRIVAMPGDPDIEYFALPVLSVERSTLDMPDMTCLTAYTEPCGPQQTTELCVPGE